MSVKIAWYIYYQMKGKWYCLVLQSAFIMKFDHLG